MSTLSVAGWGQFGWGRSWWDGSEFLDLIIDRTQADVVQRTPKGYYNATDLNRVGDAIQYVSALLLEIGYALSIAPKSDWTISDIQKADQMERYLADIVAIRNTLAMGPNVPPAPSDMDGLNTTEANNIEQILLDTEDAIIRITSSWFYAGEIYAGEV